MTVAAAIFAATTGEALVPIDGQPAVRRLVDLAWSGGALPIVVVAPDADGQVAAALAGAPVTLAEAAPGDGGGTGIDIRAVVHAFAAAADEVSGIDGVLVWPVRYVWVGPETITSLIEAHGLAAETLIVPTWADQPGWPLLLPGAALGALRSLDEGTDIVQAIALLATAGFGTWPLHLGDPGAVLDSATPRDQLPPYEGPPGPVAGQPHEWGAAVADDAEDSPPGGPAVATYPPPGHEDEG